MPGGKRVREYRVLPSHHPDGTRRCVHARNDLDGVSLLRRGLLRTRRSLSNPSRTNSRGACPNLGGPLEWRLEPTKFSLEPRPLGRLLWRRPNPPSLGSAVVTLCREPGTGVFWSRIDGSLRHLLAGDRSSGARSISVHLARSVRTELVINLKITKHPVKRPLVRQRRWAFPIRPRMCCEVGWAQARPHRARVHSSNVEIAPRKSDPHGRPTWNFGSIAAQ
jgi:hypothetical protein